MVAMLTPEEAQARVLALVQPMPVKRISCEDAVGLYLAHDLRARRTQPPANLSAMDGYAIGGDAAGPWRLVGESRAGAPFARALEAGETVRISTGAHMPVGADRVLIQENAKVEGETVSCVEDFPDPLRHVRQRGSDFAEGDVVVCAGTRIGPAQLALALSAGHAELDIRRAPSVAVLDSGDELVADPMDCAEHQIPASNGAMIGAMLKAIGCRVTRLGPVPDDADALAKALAEAEGADLLVTTGGASVGDHDLMRPALEAWGANLDFWKVAMKPGKPIMVATRERSDGRQVIFGLPGNPVSSFVTCFLFVLPLIRAAMGAADPLPRRALLPSGCELPPVGTRHEFLRARWDGKHVTLADSQDSSALGALANANCLIDRLPNGGRIEAGTSVPVILLENGGIA
ncbi:MAG: molybdopterin biosynthesis protein [Sphingomonadales bacterium BRH_c3]|nr:MAG: molybdopterin biosynthesis protein [Sphingomonadales bacterium BRH_c3]